MSVLQIPAICFTWNKRGNKKNKDYICMYLY